MITLKAFKVIGLVSYRNHPDRSVISDTVTDNPEKAIQGWYSKVNSNDWAVTKMTIVAILHTDNRNIKRGAIQVNTDINLPVVTHIEDNVRREAS